MKEGDSFGELALINSKPRSATVIANSKTQCAVLEKEQFKKILQKYEMEKQEALIALLNSFTFFK